MAERATYTTADGDMIDWICWHRYGRTVGVVERVLETNPGLAAYGPVLPAGLQVVLPVVPPPATTRVQRIWS